MISLATLRTEIADAPSQTPPPLEPPETIGIGDGVQTIFFLRYRNVADGTLTVYFGADAPANTQPGPPVYTAQLASTWSHLDGIVTFAAAPVVGTLVAARYTASYFSDVDLQGYLDRAAARHSDDSDLLKQAHADVIGAMLSNTAALELIHHADYSRDRSQVVRALTELRKSFIAELTTSPQTGANVPYGGTVSMALRPYSDTR